LSARDTRLTPLLPLVRGLSEFLGPTCEVVLHDLGELPHSIIAIEHGDVTGRQVGGVPTDRMLETLRRGPGADEQYRVYLSGSRGKLLRSLSVPLRDERGEAYALLGLNMDVTLLVQAQHALSQLSGAADGDGTRPAENEEIFTGDIRDVVAAMIARALAEVGKSVASMSRDEKMDVVRRLEERGAFLVKRSAEQVAEALDLSRFTIFSYLKEIRAGNGGGAHDDGETVQDAAGDES
jgi:predicted transcriptional regulator YheO